MKIEKPDWYKLTHSKVYPFEVLDQWFQENVEPVNKVLEDGYFIEEQWRYVENYSEYKVSDKGRVLSLKRNKYLKQFDSNGYKYVHLYNEKENKRFSVHSLVLNAFEDRPGWATQVNHIDGNKANNVRENLEWSDTSHNTQHAYDTGLLVNSHTKLDDRLIEIAIKLYDDYGFRKSVLDEVFGVSNGCVSKRIKEYKIKRAQDNFQRKRKETESHE